MIVFWRGTLANPMKQQWGLKWCVKMFLRGGRGGTKCGGLETLIWVCLSIFQERWEGGPYLSPPPGTMLLLFVLVLFQINRYCLGERVAAEIGSYNKITKFLKNTSWFCKVCLGAKFPKVLFPRLYACPFCHLLSHLLRYNMLSWNFFS